MKTFKVKVNNKCYDVEVEEVESGLPSALTKEIKPAPVTAIIKKMESSRGKNAGTSHTIKAPLPGLVVEIAVKEGQKIEQGQKVLLLEAMKMENNLLSPVTGTIEKILVEVGDSVNNSQEMLIISLSPR